MRSTGLLSAVLNVVTHAEIRRLHLIEDPRHFMSAAQLVVEREETVKRPTLQVFALTRQKNNECQNKHVKTVQPGNKICECLSNAQYLFKHLSLRALITCFISFHLLKKGPIGR